ncbi:MAG: hypothetical protein JW982_14250 [Spirochaetes bacterium]|nr:hypothetical protein [Spirochaetota bacterium]
MEKIIHHHTSANIDSFFLDNIITVSSRFRLSGSEIFKDLVQLTINQIKSKKTSGILTEYQDHKPENWKTLYYSLNTEEIELFTAARQSHKISISKLAFIGFLLFWKLLIFIYKNKYLKKHEISLYSYIKYQKKLQNFIIYFKKRINLIQKE